MPNVRSSIFILFPHLVIPICLICAVECDGNRTVNFEFQGVIDSKNGIYTNLN